jgi:hypothetical protein
MCSLRFENNFLTVEGVRFASIWKKTPLSKLSFAFVSLALPLLITSYIFLYFLEITAPVKSLQFPEERPRRFDVRKGELILEDFGMNEKKSKWLTFSLCHSLLALARIYILFYTFTLIKEENRRDRLCNFQAEWLERVCCQCQSRNRVRSRPSDTVESEMKQMKHC